MSANGLVAGALGWAFLCVGAAQAQPPAAPLPTPQAGGQPTTNQPVISQPAVTNPPSVPLGTDGTALPVKPADAPIPAVTHAPDLPPGSVSSPWNGPGGTGCCGPVGQHGPIQSELYLRSGVNLPVAGGIFNNATQAGFVQQFGARSLFMNPAGSAAWTAEVGIDYIYNNGGRHDLEYDMFGLFVSIREYHRAAAHLALGREIWLFTPAYQPGTNWRAGWDVGGRYGWSRANLNAPTDNGTPRPIEFSRRGDVYGGVFVAFHTDLEFALNCCTSFIVGVRGEWGYNFSDIIPTWDSDLQDVNVMLNFGWRF